MSINDSWNYFIIKGITLSNSASIKIRTITGTFDTLISQTNTFNKWAISVRKYGNCTIKVKFIERLHVMLLLKTVGMFSLD